MLLCLSSFVLMAGEVEESPPVLLLHDLAVASTSPATTSRKNPSSSIMVGSSHEARTASMGVSIAFRRPMRPPAVSSSCSPQVPQFRLLETEPMPRPATPTAASPAHRTERYLA